MVDVDFNFCISHDAVVRCDLCYYGGKVDCCTAQKEFKGASITALLNSAGRSRHLLYLGHVGVVYIDRVSLRLYHENITWENL